MRRRQADIVKGIELHVCHVVRQFPPAIGGLEEAVSNLAAALATIPGIETSVVTLDRRFGDLATRLPAHGAHRGVPVRRIPFHGSTRYPIAPAVLRSLRGADIVHVHAIDFFFDFLALTRPLHRRPLVASTHGGFFHTAFASTFKRLYFNSITRVSAKRYARIFGSSENDSALFRRIAPKRTVTIENGVDIDKWRGRAAVEQVPAMICIGRFSSNKAIPRLFTLLAALGEPWRLIIAGQESDTTATDLRHAADGAGVGGRVEIVTDADDAAMTELIGRASYVVSASRYEGFGLSIVEGMSAGLTPLVSAIPPFERLIALTGRGVAIDFDDPGAAAGAVCAAHLAARDDYARERLLNIAAVERYGWPGVAAQFAEAYGEALAHPR